MTNLKARHKTALSIFLWGMHFFSSYGQSDSIPQKNGITTEFTIDLNSSYVWRGVYNDSKPNIQPTFSIKYNDFTLELFGSNNIDNSYQEFDYTLSYEQSGFTLSLSDYFYDFSKNYGDFSTDSPHLIDLALEYETGENHQFGILASCLLYGGDKQRFYATTSTNNSQNYSTYLQTSYTLKKGEQTYIFLIGGTTHQGLYSENANISNIGFEYQQEIQLTKKKNCSPKFGLWINPSSNQLLFSCGIKL